MGLANRLTVSGLSRAERCPRSAATDAVVVSHEEASDVYRARGSAIARYLALVDQLAANGARDLGDAREAALELMEPASRAWCSVVDLEALPHGTGQWAVEVALAWDPWEMRGQELSRGSTARAYDSLEPHLLPGTADALALADDGRRVVVLDVKTGWKPLGPPGQALQLLGYAVAAADTYGATGADVGWVWLHEDGLPRYEMASLDAFDLDAARARVQDVWGAVQRAKRQLPPPVAGPWCQHCPAFLRCPAQAELLGALVGTDNPFGDLADADMGLVLAKLERAEAVVEAVRESVRTYAKARPIPLEDGRVYGLQEQTHTGLDADTIEAKLPELAPALVRVEKKASLEDLRAVARERADKRNAELAALTIGGKVPRKDRATIGGEERLLRAQLQAAGALSEVVVPKLTKFHLKGDGKDE